MFTTRSQTTLGGALKTVENLFRSMSNEDSVHLRTQSDTFNPSRDDSFWLALAGALICSISCMGFFLWFTVFGFHPFLWVIFTVVPAFMFLAGASLNLVEEIFIFTLWILLVLTLFWAFGSLSSSEDTGVKEWAIGIQRFRLPVLTAGVVPLILGWGFRHVRWRRFD